MTEIIICGIGGKMGSALTMRAAEIGGIKIVAGVDRFAGGSFGCPVFKSFADCTVPCDVVIDFSRPEALGDILGYCHKTGAAAVLASTGYSKDDLELIENQSKLLTLFKSPNMSVGVSLVTELCKKAAEFLGESYDIEIIEKHHNKKVDAPSGTALSIADSINSVFYGKKNYIYGREGTNESRQSSEIGIHAVRGGNIAGEHEVLFIGNDEVITISHSATSKQIFADGALRAAHFLKGRPSGLYSMKDVVDICISC